MCCGLGLISYWCVKRPHPTSLVREVAVILELSESYECGRVTEIDCHKNLTIFRNNTKLVGALSSHYEERER